MITELTKEQKDILGNENFKGILVIADSSPCCYCSNFYFKDEVYDPCFDCRNLINFVGIECVTWEN